ncbi:MAG: TetR/AcrR family transcriptional regulator [Mucilaginibacter sp.]|nr:TetR/AcrR family transcriptional regulator [Mucilaginibacter sp.]
MGKAERTREYIVEKTAPIFNRKGFAGTSMSDLTETTGLTKGAIYGNFENKDEVALAAFDYNVERMIKQVRTLQASHPTAIGKLEAYIAVYRRGLFKPFLSTGCPIINTGVEADDTHPQLKQKVNDAVAKWHRSISAIIHQGIRAGEIKEDVNVAAFASLMIAMIEGGITVSKISGDLSYLTQSLDHLEQLIALQLKK